MLSVAKHLIKAYKILRYAQDDNRRDISTNSQQKQKALKIKS
jgi:hypothetical protein